RGRRAREDGRKRCRRREADVSVALRPRSVAQPGGRLRRPRAADARRHEVDQGLAGRHRGMGGRAAELMVNLSTTEDTGDTEGMLYKILLRVLRVPRGGEL